MSVTFYYHGGVPNQKPDDHILPAAALGLNYTWAYQWNTAGLNMESYRHLTRHSLSCWEATDVRFGLFADNCCYRYCALS